MEDILMSIWKNLVARWGSSAGQVDDVRIDASTNSLQTVSYAHHEIHSGSSFFTGNHVALGNGDTYDILIVTPNTTTYSHLIFTVTVSAEATFDFYEAVTATGNGTELDMFSRNRQKDTTPGTTFYHTPTGLGALTTVLGEGILGNGKGVGGGIRDAEEFILKPNTKYLFRMANEVAGTNEYDWQFNWYEHTDKH